MFEIVHDNDGDLKERQLSITSATEASRMQTTALAPPPGFGQLNNKPRMVATLDHNLYSKAGIEILRKVHL